MPGETGSRHWVQARLPRLHPVYTGMRHAYTAGASGGRGTNVGSPPVV